MEKSIAEYIASFETILQEINQSLKEIAQHGIPEKPRKTWRNFLEDATTESQNTVEG